MKFGISLFFESLSINFKFNLNLTKMTDIRANIWCSVMFFESPAECKIMWNNMEEPSKTQMTIQRLSIVCWIPKATDTRLEYVMRTAFPTATVVTRTRLNVTVYVHCLSYISVLPVSDLCILYGWWRQHSWSKPVGVHFIWKKLILVYISALYIYIYIYIYTHTHTYVYIYVYIFD